jgi:hypothetical protein
MISLPRSPRVTRIERISADMSWPTESGEFHLGDFPLQSGAVLHGAKIVW